MVDNTQLGKNLMQSAGIGGYIGYLLLLIQVWNGWPDWAKIVTVIGGIILFAAIFYLINRLTVSQIKEMASKIEILLDIIGKLQNNVTPPTPTPTPVPTPTPTPAPTPEPKYPVWEGVTYTEINGLDITIIDPKVWKGTVKTGKFEEWPIAVMSIWWVDHVHSAAKFDPFGNVVWAFNADPFDVIPDKTVTDEYNDIWTSKTPLLDVFTKYGQAGINVIIDPKVRELMGETGYQIALNNSLNQSIEGQRRDAIKILCAMHPEFHPPSQ